MYKYKYPKPSVTVDCVLFGYEPGRRSIDILLIKRKDDPFKGHWALPGGFVEVGKEDDTTESSHPDQGESLEDAVYRELKEETGAEIDFLEQLYTFGTPNRDPRGRVVSVAYWGLVRSKDHKVQADSDAAEAEWVQVDVALGPKYKLAFDHGKVLDMAVKRLQSKTRYAPIGFNLLPTKFSMLELQQLYEALLLRPIDKSNFRKKMLSAGILTQAGEREHGKTTIQTFKFNKRAYDKASSAGFNFEPKYKKAV